MRKRLKLNTFLIVLFFFLFLLMTPLIIHGKTPQSTQLVKVAYTEKDFVAEIAQDVKPLAKIYGVRPSVIIGQIILETNSGRTLLAARYKNLFSLTARPGQDFIGLIKSRPTSQSRGNSKVHFVHYRNWEASIADYFYTLRNGQLWGKHLYRLLATEVGYKEAAQALEEYIYPDDKHYSDKLIKVIEENNLTAYDKKN
ncbi:glucosaminidase domain-containing protein [Streptococcus catagoni]|uniref:glucosaminidase domain-containing protein n=1 Tax=Streptococcus catagoni TaxID=2654874 RepID=UPI00140806B7|nr:glucosaminidase domain-containing protein [Streptococcus catagoni]